jgi:hypothetical protein
MRRPLAPAPVWAISSPAAFATFAVLAAFRFLSTPPWPDDWDGIGFVDAVTRYDLDHFAPHPPGYPVYVALLRVAFSFTSVPMQAANSVAIAAGLAAVLFVAGAALRRLGVARAAWIASFVTLSPLVWRASTAVGSEGPAFAFASAAIFGATCRRTSAPWWIGAAIGLGLGVRLSWAPLFVPLFALAPPGTRVRTLLVAIGATLSWCIPFIAIVGPSHLLALMRTHATGHFMVWGGSAIREPGATLRAAWLARDLFVDGLGVDADILGLGIAALGTGLGWLGFSAWRANGYPHARWLALFVPYAAWIGLGQNLHQQPRHALPLVAALAAALGLAATTSPRTRATGALFLALTALRTGDDAHARLTIPPPGEQLARLALSLAAGVATFGGPSARFFELHPGSVSGTVATLGEVHLALARLSPLPSRVLVTSELEGLATSSYPLEPLATLCRPARIDRRAPCIDVLEWKAPFLKR